MTSRWADKVYPGSDELPPREGSQRFEELQDDFPGADEDRPWTDGKLLKYLYKERLLSANQISKGWDCSIATVLKWLEEHNIEKRTPSEAIQNSHGSLKAATFDTHHKGYERWRSGKDYVAHHRLLAVVKYGLQGIRGKDVHHKNGISWDNRIENIEVVDPDEHQRHHRKVEGVDRIRVAELYEHGDISTRDLGSVVGLSGATVRMIYKEFYGEQ